MELNYFCINCMPFDFCLEYILIYLAELSNILIDVCLNWSLDFDYFIIYNGKLYLNPEQTQFIQFTLQTLVLPQFAQD